MNRQRTLNYIAFPVLLVAAALSIYWVWGLLFLWWVVPAVMSGQAHFVFEVSRERRPDPVLGRGRPLGCVRCHDRRRQPVSAICRLACLRCPK